MDSQFYDSALKRLNSLAKPPGSLGKLEELSARLSHIQQTTTPKADKIKVCVFAGDHGIAREEAVSPYPPNVTALMVKTFLAEKAAINSIASSTDVSLEVIDCGVEGLSTYSPKDYKIEFNNTHRASNPTKNIKNSPAMSQAELKNAMQAGQDAAQRLVAGGYDIAAAGEMGIGNTSSATAIFCSLLNEKASRLAGSGTGLTPEGVANKAKIIQKACDRVSYETNPYEILRQLGGYEIAAITQFFIELSKHNIPILLDGFIATSAALVAIAIDPEVKQFLIPATVSGEQAHRFILEKMDLQESILDMGLRLGEGTGACLAAPILRAACCMQNNMATLQDVLDGNI